MLKVGILLPLLLLLASCGGGSSDKEIVEQNTAPQISGASQVEVKALDEMSFELSVVDNENDEISFSIDNKPQWLSASKESGAIKFVATPDFLDIATYDLTVSVSDGKSTTAHDFTVDVQDNPDKWSFIDVTQDDILGGWYSDEQDLAFTFDKQNTGSLLFSEQRGFLRYDFADGVVISASVRTRGDSYNYSHEDIKLQAVAKSINKLRVVMTQSEQVYSYTLHRMQPPEELHYTTDVESNDYSYDPVSSDTTIKLFSLNMNELDSSMDVNRIEYGSTGILGKYDGQTGVFTSASPGYTFYSGHMSSGTLNYGWVFLQADVKAQILGMFKGHLFYTTEHTVSIAEETEEDYSTPELEAFLQQSPFFDSIVKRIKPLERVSAPELTLGNTYTGLRLWYESNSGEEPYGVYYGSTFQAFDEQTIKAYRRNIEPFNEQVAEYQYILENNELKLTRNAEVTHHRFYKMPSGKIGISSVKRYDNIYYERLSLFSEVKEHYSQEDYFGTYQLTYYDNDYYNEFDFMFSIQLEQDYAIRSRGSEVGEQRDFVRWESDGSITVLEGYCPDATDFETCRQASNNSSFVFSNYKLLDKNDEYSLFLRQFFFEDDNFYGHSIQRLKHK
ncbi:hypothetical protein PSECIP111854_00388 [Pseudoalteromonas sp. CIP111854]|uniref:Cadherin domain-containing protein n=1 Tax=Pseudoalteromonas holothuriae TaxID=2963714 RepID=A0A9W4VR64_9GAMM|nr:cadherin repeat domain-containing protein [Pseudoalteromonas sp. CIP111854]CAH9049850.1 hypothetical protein PSECIP111854_00388 [Pseudoalteromonas sp. CIP111854]